MYADVETLVNRDLPMLYTHFVPLMQAGTKKLQALQAGLHRPFQ